jgi:hypothetical protein
MVAALYQDEGERPMKRIVIAGALAGLAMFVWESIAHMVLPLGEMGLSTMPNEAAVRAVLAAQLGGADGLFVYPAIAMGDTPTPGPWGLLLYHPQIAFSWGVLGWEALNELVMGLALALVIALGQVASFGQRMALAALVGIAGAFSVSPSYTIWFGFPEAYTVAQMLVAFVDYIVGGAVVALLLKPRAVATGA